MAEPQHLLVTAGDPSGDRHAAALVRELKSQRPNLRVSALGGRFLRDTADRFIFDLVELGGFGFWEPLLKLPRFYRALHAVRTVLLRDRPDLVVPIDFYGFNIRVAESAKALGIPATYYISPQVWASRPGRIQALARSIQKMLVIFPFEESLYAQAGVSAQFVGHPLTTLVPDPLEQEPREQAIGFLPGSRRSVVYRHLPVIAETAQRLHERYPSASMTLIRPEEIEESFYSSCLAACPWMSLSTDPGYERRKRFTLTYSVSGTAALENMLLGLPMILFYRVSPLTYWIARRLARVHWIGIPNILAGREIVPEFVQHTCTPAALETEGVRLLESAASRQRMRQDLWGLRKTLVPRSASKTVVAEILADLDRKARAA